MSDLCRTICEIIENKGYVCSTANVTTDDGYILETFRLSSPSTPLNANTSVALLWHGLMDCRFTFFMPAVWVAR